MSYIDREQLRDKWIWGVTDKSGETECIEVKDLDAMPDADVEPIRHGEWKSDRLVTTNGGTYGVRRCSECEAYYQDVGYGWNYCPNCGAHMDKGEVDI